jgi:hypothetical protein
MNLIPIQKKPQILFLCILSALCVSGESYEPEFPKSIGVKPPSFRAVRPSHLTCLQDVLTEGMRNKKR